MSSAQDLQAYLGSEAQEQTSKNQGENSYLTALKDDQAQNQANADQAKNTQKLENISQAVGFNAPEILNRFSKHYDATDKTKSFGERAGEALGNTLKDFIPFGHTISNGIKNARKAYSVAKVVQHVTAVASSSTKDPTAAHNALVNELGNQLGIQPGSSKDDVFQAVAHVALPNAKDKGESAKDAIVDLGGKLLSKNIGPGAESFIQPALNGDLNGSQEALKNYASDMLLKQLPVDVKARIATVQKLQSSVDEFSKTGDPNVSGVTPEHLVALMKTAPASVVNPNISDQELTARAQEMKKWATGSTPLLDGTSTRQLQNFNDARQVVKGALTDSTSLQTIATNSNSSRHAQAAGDILRATKVTGRDLTADPYTPNEVATLSTGYLHNALLTSKDSNELRSKLPDVLSAIYQDKTNSPSPTSISELPFAREISEGLITNNYDKLKSAVVNNAADQIIKPTLDKYTAQQPIAGDTLHKIIKARALNIPDSAETPTDVSSPQLIHTIRAAPTLFKVSDKDKATLSKLNTTATALNGAYNKISNDNTIDPRSVTPEDVSKRASAAVESLRPAMGQAIRDQASNPKLSTFTQKSFGTISDVVSSSQPIKEALASKKSEALQNLTELAPERQRASVKKVLNITSKAVDLAKEHFDNNPDSKGFDYKSAVKGIISKSAQTVKSTASRFATGLKNSLVGEGGFTAKRPTIDSEADKLTTKQEDDMLSSLRSAVHNKTGTSNNFTNNDALHSVVDNVLSDKTARGNSPLDPAEPPTLGAVSAAMTAESEHPDTTPEDNERTQAALTHVANIVDQEGTNVAVNSSKPANKISEDDLRRGLNLPPKQQDQQQPTTASSEEAGGTGFGGGGNESQNADRQQTGANFATGEEEGGVRENENERLTGGSSGNSLGAVGSVLGNGGQFVGEVVNKIAGLFKSNAKSKTPTKTPTASTTETTRRGVNAPVTTGSLNANSAGFNTHSFNDLDDVEDEPRAAGNTTNTTSRPPPDRPSYAPEPKDTNAEPLPDVELQDASKFSRSNYDEPDNNEEPKETPSQAKERLDDGQIIHEDPDPIVQTHEAAVGNQPEDPPFAPPAYKPTPEDATHEPPPPAAQQAYVDSRNPADLAFSSNVNSSNVAGTGSEGSGSDAASAERQVNQTQVNQLQQTATESTAVTNLADQSKANAVFQTKGVDEQVQNDDAEEKDEEETPGDKTKTAAEDTAEGGAAGGVIGAVVGLVGGIIGAFQHQSVPPYVSPPTPPQIIDEPPPVAQTNIVSGTSGFTTDTGAV